MTEIHRFAAFFFQKLPVSDQHLDIPVAGNVQLYLSGGVPFHLKDGKLPVCQIRTIFGKIQGLHLTGLNTGRFHQGVGGQLVQPETGHFLRNVQDVPLIPHVIIRRTEIKAAPAHQLLHRDMAVGI